MRPRRDLGKGDGYSHPQPRKFPRREVRGECSMDRDKGLKDIDSPSLESVHQVKLEALLHDLMRKHVTMQPARMLRVN